MVVDEKRTTGVSSIWCIAFLGNKATYTINIGKYTQEWPTGEIVILVMQLGDIYVLYLNTLIIIIIFNYRLDLYIMVRYPIISLLLILKIKAKYKQFILSIIAVISFI